MARNIDSTIYRTVRNAGITYAEIRRIVLIVAAGIRRKPLISIHLIGDKRMRRMNREYRGKDKTTDVLSFSTLDGTPIPRAADTAFGNDWGDIFISIPQIKRQAKQYGRPYKEEFTRMLVHGILHLAGYDHEKTADADIMMPLQERLVISTMYEIRNRPKLRKLTVRKLSTAKFS